jgi:hypothetical protein
VRFEDAAVLADEENAARSVFREHAGLDDA